MQNELQHSAKGSHWQKKNHKYIAIENGKYIYPEDVKGGSGKHHLSRREAQQSPYARMYNKRLREDLSNVWNSNVTKPLNKINPVYRAKQRKAKEEEIQNRAKKAKEKLDAEQQRFDTINKINKKEQNNKKKYVYSYDQRGIATKTPKSDLDWQEAEAKRAKQREQWTEGNRRAKQIADARTATKRAYFREKQLAKERQAASGYDEKGNRIRHIEPKGHATHDNRGFQKNLPAASTEYDEHGVKYTGRAARKHRILAEKAAKKAEREQKIKQKELTQQTKEALKHRKKAEKERRKEIDKQIPAEMRRKRNLKRGKKAVMNLLNKITGYSSK